MYDNKSTRRVNVGNVALGGGAAVSVQSMLSVPAHDIEGNVAQAKALEAAGCDILRVSVPDKDTIKTVEALKKAIKIPLVADIHFDWRLAVESVAAGIDKVRINPGNIGDESHVKAVADACRKAGVPIRIGVNSGSLEKHILEKYGSPTPEALCESALFHASILEKYDFYDTAISIKSSDVAGMIAANRLVAERCDYPIHIGVTEAGNERRGAIKSAIGIGSLLADGIGDTLRVSLTADPVREIASAKDILSALEIEGQCGMNIVSCPTCGRTKINLIELSNRFESAITEEGLSDLPITVALMGCIVNGPGEAREADIGIAGGKGEALLFKHGQPVRKIGESEIIPTLISEIKKIKEERK